MILTATATQSIINITIQRVGCLYCGLLIAEIWKGRKQMRFVQTIYFERRFYLYCIAFTGSSFICFRWLKWHSFNKNNRVCENKGQGVVTVASHKREKMWTNTTALWAPSNDETWRKSSGLARGELWYSKTCVSDHSYIATTCLLRPLSLGRIVLV